MKYRFYILFTLLLTCATLYAQELTIRSFKESNDIIARVDERKDLNKQPCALIKVQVALKDVKFEGSVVGEPIYKTSEYWVYVPKGKQTLRVKHPDYLPLEIKLPYGDEVKELKGNRVYILTLVTNIPDPDPNPIVTGGIMLKVTPANAKVTIDGVSRPLGEKGICLATLSDGEHEYTVSAEGYATKSETFTISGQPIERSVQLVRDIASLNIDTDIDGAEIRINGELKGNCRWKGELTSGPVEIGIVKTGYKPYRQTISLKTNEEKVIRISVKDLEVTTGSIRVNCNIEGASVYVDNEYKGTTPGEFRRIPTGKHKLKVTKDGYENYTTDVEVPENRFVNVEVNLKVKSPTPADNSVVSGIYIEPSYQLISCSGVGIEVGAFISNFNVEAQYLIGPSSSDKVYWYASDGSLNGSSEYGSNRLAIRAGYRIPLAGKLDLTPQLGVGILMVSAKESTSAINDKSYAGSMLLSTRLTFSLTKNIQLALTPEYSLAVSKGKVYDQATQVSSTMKSWADGFNLRAGVSFIF